MDACTPSLAGRFPVTGVEQSLGTPMLLKLYRTKLRLRDNSLTLINAKLLLLLGGAKSDTSKCCPKACLHKVATLGDVER